MRERIGIRAIESLRGLWDNQGMADNRASEDLAERDARLRVENRCWECEGPLDTPEDRERGAHQECVYAHMDYVERWG